MNVYPALIYDVETSGLPDFSKPADAEGQPFVVSLAAALITDTAVLSAFHCLVIPRSFDIPEMTKAIHGIQTWQCYERGRPISEVLDRFDAMRSQAEVEASYGHSFDSKMMRGEQRRLGRADHYGEKPVFCIMRACAEICAMPPTDSMMRAGRKTPKTPKLSEAAGLVLNRPHPNAHDAKADVQMAALLYRHLAARDLVVPKLQERKTAP